MSGGTGWGDVMGGNKPPAQGPGPGQMLMKNGDDGPFNNMPMFMSQVQMLKEVSSIDNLI